MIIILTTTSHKNQILECISSVERLDELITVVTDAENKSNTLVVGDGLIHYALDWHDNVPPYILPSIDYSDDNLLAMVFYSLGNYQKALEYLTESSLLYHNISIATHIRFGYEISEAQYLAAEMSKHNQCIVHHYGNYANRYTFEALEKAYINTIEIASNDELKIFTAKQYINLLIDTQLFSKAETVIRSLQDNVISDNAKNALNVQLATAMMQQLEVPFDTNHLNNIQDLFQKSIAFYEKQELKINAGLLLIDASEIANYTQDFTASKDFINKAILYFKEENVPEFLGEAGIRKATLLYTWSKKGQPQYYKSAINAFQDTLKIFKRDTHPKKFADIHHNMALIYSEIPVLPEEKPMWTAFCASSFKEALVFYTKDEYPYENAMVSHNYATALMNFPEAKLHNNLDKAFGLFEEALTVRKAKKYPFERASTLINQLELYWLLHNETHKDETKRLDEMRHKINEIKTLVKDAGMLEKAAFHETKLQSLKTVL